MVHRQAKPEVVEDAKARLMDAIARERKGAALSRVQARLFAPAAENGGPEEHALGGFAAFPVVTNERLVGLLALGGKALARHVAGDAPPSSARSRTSRTSSWRTAGSSSACATCPSATASPASTTTGTSWSWCRRSSTAWTGTRTRFSVLMIDIDHFKKVNDEHGHPAGDAVLREIAVVIEGCLRTVDAVGRYGGEEFVVLLPHTPHDEAMQTAERVRSQVAGHVFRAPESAPLQVTISVGVATAPAEAAGTAAARDPRGGQGPLSGESAGRDRSGLTLSARRSSGAGSA